MSRDAGPVLLPSETPPPSRVGVHGWSDGVRGSGTPTYRTSLTRCWSGRSRMSRRGRSTTTGSSSILLTRTCTVPGESVTGPSPVGTTSFQPLTLETDLPGKGTPQSQKTRSYMIRYSTLPIGTRTFYRFTADKGPPHSRPQRQDPRTGSRRLPQDGSGGPSSRGVGGLIGPAGLYRQGPFPVLPLGGGSQPFLTSGTHRSDIDRLGGSPLFQYPRSLGLVSRSRVGPCRRRFPFLGPEGVSTQV